MTGRGMYRRLESGRAEGLRHPLRGAHGVRVVLASRADAGNPEEVEELVADACVVRREVGVEVVNGGHRARCQVWEYVMKRGKPNVSVSECDDNSLVYYRVYVSPTALSDDHLSRATSGR